ncbi:MAG TPA: NAD(P)H-hydrate dehydratase [Bryobacteraceae bacterium]|nr:NAD(P)H-hydrate dehydratase [Bryobacteraceae bacterium]
MKVLTAAQMREVDQKTIEGGLSNELLMENAGCRVVEFLVERFSPLNEHRFVILCGKGNNGGDGLVVARQLRARFQPAALHVVRTEDESIAITEEMQQATIVIDALLGTGLQGPSRGRSLELIRAINAGFPLAKVVAIDIPSGMTSDSGVSEGEVARADYTVTFTALKVAHAMPPNCDRMGEIRVAQIGSAPTLYEHVPLNLTTAEDFRELLRPRGFETNKGDFGHVLVIGGAEGKTGAAHMTGLGALRVGAGLVTVGSTKDWFVEPELMTAPLPSSYQEFAEISRKMDVVAAGPGLGSEAHHVDLARRIAAEASQMCVLDADAVNALAGVDWHARDRVRVLTPHPGEMGRLAQKPTAEVQKDRIGTAQAYASTHGCTLVLKGHRTITAFPDGETWINPVDSPALAKGGTGDVLAGMLAGMLGQHPDDWRKAVIAGIYLHGLSGHLGAQRWTDRCLLATELLQFLPEAIRASAPDFRYR